MYCGEKSGTERIGWNESRAGATGEGKEKESMDEQEKGRVEESGGVFNIEHNSLKLKNIDKVKFSSFYFRLSPLGRCSQDGKI